MNEAEKYRRAQTYFPVTVFNVIITENYLADTVSVVAYVRSFAGYLKPQASQISPWRSL